MARGPRSAKPPPRTLVIVAAPDGRATALAYRLAVSGAPPIAYAAEAIYRVDGKGRLRGCWTDNIGRTRPTGGRLAVSEWINFWDSADVEIGPQPMSSKRLTGC